MYRNLFICVMYCFRVPFLLNLGPAPKLSRGNLCLKNPGTSFGSSVGENIINWVIILLYFFIVLGLTDPIFCL